MVHLAEPYELVAKLLAAQRGHFMHPAAAGLPVRHLEPLAPDEPGITLDLTLRPDLLTVAILAAFCPESAG
jgi:gluconokinase